MYNLGDYYGTYRRGYIIQECEGGGVTPAHKALQSKLAKIISISEKTAPKSDGTFLESEVDGWNVAVAEYKGTNDKQASEKLVVLLDTKNVDGIALSKISESDLSKVQQEIKDKGLDKKLGLEVALVGKHKGLYSETYRLIFDAEKVKAANPVTAKKEFESAETLKGILKEYHTHEVNPNLAH